MSKKQIVVYCTNQNRSLKLIDALESMNYSGEILFVTDGINGWKANDFDIVTDEENSENGTDNIEKNLH